MVSFISLNILAMRTSMSIIYFRKQFKTEEDCINYLIEQKWGIGYKCIKCGNDKYGKGRQWFYRRYNSCGYDESVTANKMFHKCKTVLS